MRARLNILHVLIAANAVLLIVAAGIGWDMMRRYNELAYGFNTRNAQKVLDFAVADIAWDDYAREAIEVGGNIAQSEAVRRVSGVRAAAHDTGTVADEVLNSSRELARRADALHQEVDRFLANVRAG